MSNYYDARLIYEKIYKDQHRKTAFNVWIGRAIESFSLIEHHDYWVDLKESKGGRPSKEYKVSYDVKCLLEQRNNFKTNIGFKNRKEIIFLSDLESILSNIELLTWLTKKVIYQYKIDKYLVDCYFPNMNLVVEYDEKYHDYIKEDDKKRDMIVSEKLKCNILRVKEGQEHKGIARIINHAIELNV